MKERKLNNTTLFIPIIDATKVPWELGPYRPKAEHELASPTHTTAVNGEPFVPVEIYGTKPGRISTRVIVPTNTGTQGDEQPFFRNKTTVYIAC